MTTYGNTPGVQVSTSTGLITGVTVGREQYLVLVGVGNQNASIDTNTARPINGRDDVDRKFGEDSDVAFAYRDALANGVNADLVYGIRAETTETTESFTALTGSVAQTPLIPDKDRLSAEDTANGVDLDIQLVYEDTPSAPSSQDFVNINPNNGEFDAEFSSSSTDLDITHEYADWDSALAEADAVVSETEFAVLMPLSNAESVATTMQTTIESMRDEFKMVLGHMAAEPNATENGYPHYDLNSFSVGVSDDTMFFAAPTMLADRTDPGADWGVGLLGATGGLLAGNPTTDPIYDDTVAGVNGVEQELTRNEILTMRDEYVIPVKDVGVTRLADNHSSYKQDTEGGWERDYFRRRLVDVVIATLYQVARQQIGAVLDGETVEDVADAVDDQLNDFVDDGLLQAGEQEFTVSRDSDRTIGVDVTITPYGVAKNADIDLTINA